MKTIITFAVGFAVAAYLYYAPFRSRVEQARSEAQPKVERAAKAMARELKQ